MICDQLCKWSCDCICAGSSEISHFLVLAGFIFHSRCGLCGYLLHSPHVAFPFGVFWLPCCHVATWAQAVQASSFGTCPGHDL
jgi:hypothetical protein